MCLAVGGRKLPDFFRNEIPCSVVVRIAAGEHVAKAPLMEPDTDRRQWVLAALDQFEGRLLRYAQRLLGDPESARDVVQFVFLRLCDQSSADIDDRLAQWLYTVCRNRALDLLKSNGREKANGRVAV